jgi:hypothetical protein
MHHASNRSGTPWGQKAQRVTRQILVGAYSSFRATFEDAKMRAHSSPPVLVAILTVLVPIELDVILRPARTAREESAL